MIQPPPFARRTLALWLMPAPWWFAAMVAALLLLAARPVVDRFDLAVHDLLVREELAPWSSPKPAADSIVVAIDDASLQALGRWPWPRQRHAELIDVLRSAGTQAVGYNVLFSEPAANPAEDARLAQAIAAHGQIVLPVVPQGRPADGQTTVLQPLAMLGKAAAALGHAEAPLDLDGQVRRVAKVAGLGATAWEAMPLAVQRVGATHAGGPAGVNAQQHAQEAWWQEQVQLLPAGDSQVTQISASELLRDPSLVTLLTGRVVWVGLTASGIDAPVTVPGPRGSTQLSAVQWQAQVHQAMERNRLVAIASASVVFVANVLPLVFAALFGRWAMRSLGVRFKVMLWLLPLPLLVEAAALVWGHLWLPMGAMALGWSIALLLSRAVELHATRTDLQRERTLAEVTLQAITDAVITLDPSHRVRYLNPSAERLLRPQGMEIAVREQPLQAVLSLAQPDEQILLQAITDCQTQQRVVAVELALHLHTHDGEHMARAVISPMRVATETEYGVVIVLTDITATARAEQAVEHGSTHDGLTGLPNRVLLTNLLAHALAHGRHQHQALAVLFIDLDRFGRINDSLGQRQGDEVLEAVAARMRRVFRPHDTIARWGNDQFVVLIEDVTSREVVAALAAQLIDVVARDLRVDDTAIACTCSVGIALSPDDAQVPDGLLTMAETAMARAKAAGGGRFEFYTSGMSTLTRDWLALENRLRHALESNEFVLHYQIQTDLRTGRPVGLEALLRWRQDDGELWAPARFLSITEETGLIVAVGNWVIREATAQVRRWIDAGVTPVPVSVNVSARQCMDSHLIDVIAGALRDANVPASLLKVEITESTAMADLDHLKQLLMQLRQLGVAIALDDFGTGFSSLAHLKRFPVDQIKIDPSFIADIHRDPNGAAIVRATIALAHGLGVPVVAEGVENEAQIRFLREHDCDIVQGYLYGRPGTPDAVREALTSADAHPRYLHPESHS
ncbi:EAL domain-containing protein [Sphaerotilus sp.]|uniref:EAL domain-containing protein n=1 Tax=Sphaerotilus sp. TaxID=2093942 RepID=UPI0025DFE3DA|nr:EAL domain-containing protein [Sphaerotilus sp.]